MTVFTHHDFYNSCTLDDLRRFIVGRKIARREAANRFHKDACIAGLLQADTDHIFRFLNLPSELRNHVYEILLPATADKLDPDTKFWPVILRVNQQIRSEAIQYLYGFRVQLTLEKARPWLDLSEEDMYGLHSSDVWKQVVKVNGDKVGVSSRWDLLHCSLEWPKHICKGQVLNIEVDLSMLKDSSYIPSEFHLLNHALYDLHCLSSGKANWQRVDIVATIDFPHKDPYVVPFLSPLLLFSGIKEWTFPKECHRGVRAQLCDVTPAPPATGRESNPLRGQKRLFQEYAVLKAILFDFAPDVQIGNEPKCFVDHHAEVIRALLNSTRLWGPKEDKTLRERVNAFGLAMAKYGGPGGRLEEHRDRALARVQGAVNRLHICQSVGMFGS